MKKWMARSMVVWLVSTVLTGCSVNFDLPNASGKWVAI